MGSELESVLGGGGLFAVVVVTGAGFGSTAFVKFFGLKLVSE